MDSEPRQAHYAFAHMVVRDLVLRQWPVVGPSFHDGSAEERLRSVWTRLSADAAADGSEDEIRVERTDRLRDPAFVVFLPTPVSAAEAAAALIIERPTGPRYFVLELGFSVVDRSNYWVLCEWDVEGHSNYGACGEFVDVRRPPVAEMLDRVGEIAG